MKFSPIMTLRMIRDLWIADADSSCFTFLRTTLTTNCLEHYRRMYELTHAMVHLHRSGKGRRSTLALVTASFPCTGAWLSPSAMHLMKGLQEHEPTTTAMAQIPSNNENPTSNRTFPWYSRRIFVVNTPAFFAALAVSPPPAQASIQSDLDFLWSLGRRGMPQVDDSLSSESGKSSSSGSKSASSDEVSSLSSDDE